MDNTIAAIGLAPSAKPKVNQSALIDVAQTGVDRSIVKRADSRLEGSVDRSADMQNRFAQLEAKAQAAGYEHLASGGHYRSGDASSGTTAMGGLGVRDGLVPAIEQFEQRIEGKIAHAQELGNSVMEFYESAAARSREYGNERAAVMFEESAAEVQQTLDDYIAQAEARTGELVGTLSSAPPGERISSAVSQHAERVVERWDTFSANMQERLAAAEVKATELGHDDLAASLGNRAEVLSERITAHTDDILARSAQLTNQLESSGDLLLAEGVDFHA